MGRARRQTQPRIPIQHLQTFKSLPIRSAPGIQLSHPSPGDLAGADKWISLIFKAAHGRTSNRKVRGYIIRHCLLICPAHQSSHVHTPSTLRLPPLTSPRSPAADSNPLTPALARQEELPAPFPLGQLRRHTRYKQAARQPQLQGIVLAIEHFKRIV